MRDLMKYGVFFFCSATFLLLLISGTWWQSRRRPSAGRTRLVNTGLVLIALLAPIVAAEGFFLFCVDSTDSALATLMSRRWLDRHLTPTKDFRGRLFRSTESLSGSGPSVAVVGDSITFGQGIARDEDLYPSILERALRERGIPADVFNISAPGWNTTHEMEALQKHYAADQTFDVVVVGFCFNDIGDYIEAVPGFKEAFKRLRMPPPFLAPITKRSFIASYIYFRIAYLASPSIRISWDKIAAAYQSPEAFLSLFQGLVGIKKMVESHGGRFIVLTFPDTSGPWDRYPYRDFHKKFGEYLKWGGVTNIDLLPVFERHPHKTLHASFLDSHPNELAHRLAAAELADALARMLVFPRQAAGSEINLVGTKQ